MDSEMPEGPHLELRLESWHPCSELCDLAAVVEYLGVPCIHYPSSGPSADFPRGPHPQSLWLETLTRPWDMG